ncbi:MAG: cytochrome c [Proteobacteria bacterium]|nr:cytochrome c [Pseudomonadota bacterium]
MNALVDQGLLTVFFTLSAVVIGASSPHASEGEEAYQRCVVCHQPDGAGIPGIFPALKNRFADIMASVEGREYFTMVLIDGLIGTIEIEGQRYVGAMPAQYLTDAQISALIDYLATNFGASDAADSNLLLSEDEVAQIRSKFSSANAQSTLDLRTRVPALNGQ